MFCSTLGYSYYDILFKKTFSFTVLLKVIPKKNNVTRLILRNSQ